MKAGLLSVAALAAMATAQIHHGHRHLHKRGQVDTHVERDTTVHTEHVVVYVDQNGNPLPNQAQDEQPAQPANAPPSTKKSSTPKPASNPKQSPPSTSGGSSGSSGYGVVYSPYTDAGGCKSQDQVNEDFKVLEGYSLVRIYGTDCDQVTTVLNAAKAKNMKVFAGIFDITQVQAEAQKIIDAAKSSWGLIDTVSVGNELVNAGTPAGDVVNALNQARSILKAAGYTGPVVTVDTFVAMIAHPELCQASDYAAANCHAFFDGGRTADQAGAFVKEQADLVSKACGGKKTVITESGWPWSGGANGAAVPSKENQAAAIKSIKANFSKDIILFTAFDDMWKKNTAATYGAEQYWGFIKQSA